MLKPDKDTKKNNEVKEEYEEYTGHRELDTSQGDFTTIAIAIFLSLAVYFMVPIVTGKRLGDFPVVIVYLGFVALVVFFWMIAEKIKHRNDKE